MKFDPIIAHTLIVKLKEVFPDLPDGKYWSKYNKDRIYYNHDEIEGYTFFLNFEQADITLGNFDEEYWLERLKISSAEDLLQETWKQYYLIIYPIEEHVPINTISDIQRFAAAEGTIISESTNVVEIDFMPFQYTVLVPKEEIDVMIPKSKTVQRIVFKRKHMEKVMSELQRLEDEEDAMFMQQLKQSTPDKIAVSLEEDRKGKIIIDKGVSARCAHCNKEFVYYDEYTEFCSAECKEEYTHIE